MEDGYESEMDLINFWCKSTQVMDSVIFFLTFFNIVW